MHAEAAQFRVGCQGETEGADSGMAEADWGGEGMAKGTGVEGVAKEVVVAPAVGREVYPGDTPVMEGVGSEMGAVGLEVAGVDWVTGVKAAVVMVGEGAAAVLVVHRQVYREEASAMEGVDWVTEGAGSGMVEVDWAMVEGGWGAASLVAMAEPRGAAKVAAKREGVARGEEEVPTVV